MAVAALAIAVFLAYLAGGRLGVGAAGVDYVFSPADPPSLQSRLAAIDVPFDRATPGAMVARASLAVAKGRRTALRDLAAVTMALAVAAFASWLIVCGVAVLPSLLASGAFAFGTFAWSYGITWHGSALDRTDGIDTVRSELTTLGGFLALLGAVVLIRSRRGRVPAAISIVLVAAVSFVAPWGWEVAIIGWALVAVAFDWLLSEAPSRSGRALIVAAAVILMAAPAAMRYRMWTLGRDRPAILAERAALDFQPAALPANAAVVSESRVVDSTIALAAHQSHRAVEFVPQSEDRIRAMVEAGRPVFAMPHARANLERLGFIFERAFIGSNPISVIAAAVPCAHLARNAAGQNVSPWLADGSLIVQGSHYDLAPGSLTLDLASEEVPRIITIEPRSTPFEIERLPNTSNIFTLRLPKTGRADPVVITLSAAPLFAAASTDNDGEVRICPGIAKEPMLGRSTMTATVRMEDNRVFGSGWHPMEKDADYFRWTSEPSARVRVSTSQPAGDIRVTLSGFPAAAATKRPTLGVRVNECQSFARPIAGQGDYSWTVAKECWRPGFNELWILTSPLVSPSGSHDTRRLGAHISGIRLSRVAADQNAK